LIAAQNESNKALVAQVGDKAIGLLAISSEVDLSILDEVFHLEQYDKLLKSEFVDLLQKKKKQIIQDRIEFIKKEKELYKQKCHEE